MRISFVDINAKVIDELEKSWMDKNPIFHRAKRFEEIGPHDVFITAGNSFGVMNGGIDLAVRDYFGKELEDRVQQTIYAQYDGEMPVGAAIMVPTYGSLYRWLCYAPTMRTPTNIVGTENVFYAMRAALLAIKHYEELGWASTIACCGLGTACGGLKPEVAAYQMALAWRSMFEPGFPRNNAELFKIKRIK